MAIQVLQRKSGKRYRVHMMRNGKRISKVFDRKKDAEKFNAQLIANDDLSNLLTQHVTSVLTLQDACSDYLAQHSGRDVSIAQRLAWWCQQYGDKPTGQITKRHVKDSLKQLKNIGRAPATINRYKAALSTVYTYLNDEYDAQYNPAREVKQLKEDNARTRFLSDYELNRLLKVSRSSNWDRLYLLVLMAVTTGARRTELLTLRWSDIDFKERVGLLKETKNGEPRVLPLTDNVLEELIKFRRIGDCYVFPHPNHQHDYFRNFDKHWIRALEKAAVANFRFHDLRHTAASILAKNGASLLQIAEVLGHKSIQMTQRYAHLCVKHKAALIDDVMGGISERARNSRISV